MRTNKNHKCKQIIIIRIINANKFMCSYLDLDLGQRRALVREDRSELLRTSEERGIKSREAGRRGEGEGEGGREWNESNRLHGVDYVFWL
jgi:hypothetical protein